MMLAGVILIPAFIAIIFAMIMWVVTWGVVRLFRNLFRWASGLS